PQWTTSDSLPCFLFNPLPTPETYPLSLHDALPISKLTAHPLPKRIRPDWDRPQLHSNYTKICNLPLPTAPLAFSTQPDFSNPGPDRKSTRLNSSHVKISYAVFCLKKKTNDESIHQF